MNQLRHLLPYFRRHRWKLAVGIGCVLAAAAVGLASPLLIGAAVDSLRQRPEARTLLTYGGLLIAVTLVQGVFTFGQRRILVAMSRDIEFELRDDYFAHLQRMSPAFYQRRYTGDLMALATNDLQAVRMICGPAIMYSANTVFTSLGALLLMLRIHVGLTLLALATLPLVAVAMKYLGQVIHDHFQRVQERFAGLSAKVQENVAGARVVRAYAVEGAERQRFAVANRDYVHSSRRLILWSASFQPLLQALVGLGFVAVLWYGGVLVIRGAVTVGEFVAFNFFLTKLIWPMMALGWVINLVQRGRASLGRILEVLEVEPEIRDRPGALAPARIEGAVRFEELDFAYEPGGPPVLSRIDLDFAAGATVAVVGRTGSGKSTLLELLPRLADPPPRSLFLDGHDILDLRLDALRAAIAFVPQESLLLSATVAENVAFGRTEAGRGEIAEAARIAGLEDDLAAMPAGLDTLVGERGITLSGGQRQRVALARAVLRRPRLLLLDDCLSAVDTATEETILANLAELFAGRTVFFVSHRVSSVRRADRIVVLDQGRVAADGRHAELLAAGGLYAELARLQELEEELAAVS